MKRVIRKLVLASLVLATIFAMGPSAWAKDAAVAAVTAPGAIVIQNGNHYAQGTNAIGTIQLFYTVVANQFAAGTFGSFTLDLSIKEGKANPATKYPLSLNLRQTGSANLILDPAIDSFPVGSSAFGGSTTVNINIPASVASDPAFQVDGAELVANLQLEVPGQRFLDTVTTIQVHLVLMHPGDVDCLIVRNFITDNGIAGEVNPLSVSKSSGSGNVSSVPTNPHYIVVAANTCSLDQCIDARFTLNSNFELKGTQAVKTFSSNSIIDEFLEAATFFGTSPTGDPN
ncbi:MAG TPA: hypothetical protein VK208_06990, partial [Pyrinomonadaceae bacterium]|nr:hypothetical protein [Pyrinomonadaceae bacterium]